jgi:protein-tyrosine-phosphatase
MRVLFVCYGNAYRSPLAEALLKKFRPDINTESAGLRVSIPISVEIKKYLKKHGALHFLKKTPENLNQKNLKSYNLIITMQNIQTQAVLQKCPECKNKIIEWNIKDPYFLGDIEAEKIYEEINSKVMQIAKTL